MNSSQNDTIWLEGALDDWTKIDSLYVKIISASEIGDQIVLKGLRRRLFYAIRRAMHHARYQGRLLRALGDATLRSDLKLSPLLRSYAVSKMEGDFYNCLLTADSLAHFFVESHFDPKHARYWIARTRFWLKRFRDSDIGTSMQRLVSEIESRKDQGFKLDTPIIARGMPKKIQR